MTDGWLLCPQVVTIEEEESNGDQWGRRFHQQGTG